MSARIDVTVDGEPTALSSLSADALAAKPLPAMIARHVGEEPFAFASLRRQGIALAQMLSGENWTDFNYHDPGVTLLEALCFALTESVYGAAQPLADQLTAADGHIHYHRLGLHAAPDILPCRPCTVSDYMRWLLDRVPGALQAHAAMPGEDGLWQLGLEVTTAQAEGATAAAARAYWAQRNLGEDLDNLPHVLRPRWCRLQLDLSVEGTRAPEDILAELVARCAEHIDAAPRRESLLERLAGDVDGTFAWSDIFDGPRARHGWVATDSLIVDQDQRVYFGDLARLANTVDGVSEIRKISLLEEGVETDEESLLRRQDGQVLRLRWPDTAAELAGWRITRHGTPVSLAAAPLLHRLEDLWRAGGRMVAEAAATMDSLPLARPTGHWIRPEPYVSMFRQLPAMYRERFDANLASMDAAEANQFRAYLVMLEQWLAHGAAQTAYLRELYTISSGSHSSYAWQVLGDAHIPGLEALYTMDPEQIAATVYAPTDAPLERRGRVLDHLLALHGEGCGQGSIQPFGWYFEAAAWRHHLFECKRQMLLRIAVLTRDRYGAIDYSRRSLGRRGNTSALQQRISLLLAFKHHHGRLLMAPMAQAGLRLADEPVRFSTVDVAPPEGRPLTLDGAGRERAIERLGDGLRGAARVLAHLFPALDLQTLPPALLRTAVHPERYRQEGPHTLWLGPDEHARWWPLRLRSPRISVQVAAICLHEFACRLQLECEGMHVVEHVLLRPHSGSDESVPDDFYRYRLSAVFSGWTARGRDQSFRRIAEETLRLSAPAHLRVQAIWLDAGAMARFERCFAAWLDAKQAHCAARLQPAADDAAVARRLDSWTRLLRWLLARQLPHAAQHEMEGGA
ncbi:MAG: hypothetical protein EPN68_11725 [Rhodanobacter sp.]|nr:MAG: hypothetical protein EPN68_11725 [Rhodanobacter sp.]